MSENVLFECNQIPFLKNLNYELLLNIQNNYMSNVFFRCLEVFNSSTYYDTYFFHMNAKLLKNDENVKI